jgi:hypothetical protein
MRNMGNRGGAVRGLDMAAAMSGRDMTGLGQPQMAMPQQALQAFPIDSRAQWAHERAVGGAMSDLPYNQWRRL